MSTADTVSIPPVIGREQVTYDREWPSRCVTIVCGGRGARSALLQARGGAGIGREPAMATCLQIGVLSTCEPLGPVDRLVRSGAGGGLRSWADAVTTHGVGGVRHAGRRGGCPAGGR